MGKYIVEKALKEKCVLSLECKREGVVDEDESGDYDNVDPTYAGL